MFKVLLVVLALIVAALAGGVYEILPGTGARTIRFQLHGGYCGGHGVPSCFKNHRITPGPSSSSCPKA